MREPFDASSSVKEAFRSVNQRVDQLEARWIQTNGAKVLGGDAVTPDGLTTLRQLRAVESLLRSLISDLQDQIDTLKQQNSLV